MAEVREVATFMACDIPGHDVDATLIAEIWAAALVGAIIVGEPVYACVGDETLGSEHEFTPDYP